MIKRDIQPYHGRGRDLMERLGICDTYGYDCIVGEKLKYFSYLLVSWSLHQRPQIPSHCFDPGVCLLHLEVFIPPVKLWGRARATRTTAPGPVSVLIALCPASCSTVEIECLHWVYNLIIFTSNVTYLTGQEFIFNAFKLSKLASLF